MSIAAQASVTASPIESTRLAPQAILQRLAATGYPQLRAVACDVHRGVVTLHGIVPSFHLKQVAQVEAAKVTDVEYVDNRLSVKRPGS